MIKKVSQLRLVIRADRSAIRQKQEDTADVVCCQVESEMTFFLVLSHFLLMTLFKKGLSSNI